MELKANDLQASNNVKETPATGNPSEAGTENASVILAGAGIVINLLNQIINALNVQRCIAFGINNHLSHDLISPRFYIYSGKTEDIPLSVKKGEAGFASASKTEGTTTGSVGVLSYHIEGTDCRLAILWSVPYDYNLYENWFKISLVNKDTPIDKALYDDMYYDRGKLTNGKVAKATQGEATWDTSVKLANKSVKLAGVMGTGGKCTLNLSLKLV